MNLADYVGRVRSVLPAAADDAQLQRLQAQLDEARLSEAGCFLLQPGAACFELVVPLDQLVEVMLKVNGAPQSPAPAVP